jgi:hypothetical protein
MPFDGWASTSSKVLSFKKSDKLFLGGASTPRPSPEGFRITNCSLNADSYRKVGKATLMSFCGILGLRLQAKAHFELGCRQVSEARHLLTVHSFTASLPHMF